MNWFLSLSTALITWINYQESIKLELIPSPTPETEVSDSITETPQSVQYNENETKSEEQRTETQEVLGESTNFQLDQINAYRAQKGMSKAEENTKVCEFASLRAQEITNNFDHNGFIERLNNNSLPYESYSLVTENIAQVNDPKIVVDMWIASPTHEENIRKDTPYICVRNVGNYYVMTGWKP